MEVPIEVPTNLKSTFLEDFAAAQRAAVPIISVETQDAASAMRAIGSLNKKVPLISWDIVEGITAKNIAGKHALEKISGQKIGNIVVDLKGSRDPDKALNICLVFPPSTIFFMQNAHRIIIAPTVAQSIYNLRDKYKIADKIGDDARVLVLLSPSLPIPDQLKQDILTLDEPLPTEVEITAVVDAVNQAAGLFSTIEEKVRQKCISTLKGLSSFALEQNYAMSIEKEGVNLNRLWLMKKHQVEQTAGVHIVQEKLTFDDVEGVSIAKQFFSRYFNGKEPATGLVLMDEIEKMFAGISGDSSGTSQEQHGEFLRWTQDNRIDGVVLVGHPGCTKTHITRCVSGQFKIPLMELNMGAMKDKHVGTTGIQTRAAFKTILAICKPLIVATSNKLETLPPELRRRFKLGTYFFDLPTKEERLAVWALYIKKYKLPVNAYLPMDDGWTPDEIATCCYNAWRYGISLHDAAKAIIPSVRSSADTIERLRIEANGRFLSASYEGAYKHNTLEVVEDGVRALKSGIKVGEA